MLEFSKLTSLHVSSASEDQISSDLPTTITYDQLITIHAPPKTDLWREPPTSTETMRLPAWYLLSLISTKFHSARVTVSVNWNTLYDQGSLVLFIPGRGYCDMDENGGQVLRGGKIVCNVWPQVGGVIFRSCRWGRRKVARWRSGWEVYGFILLMRRHGG